MGGCPAHHLPPPLKDLPPASGWFADDVYGLGSPGSPDVTPVVKQSGLTPPEVALWNKGQQAAVVGAQVRGCAMPWQFCSNTACWSDRRPAGCELPSCFPQNLAVNKYGAFNWQNFQPMCEPGHDEPCPNGWTGMAAPSKEYCLNGAPVRRTLHPVSPVSSCTRGGAAGVESGFKPQI